MDQNAMHYLDSHKITSIFEHLLTVLLLDRPTDPSAHLVKELKKLQSHHATLGDKKGAFLPPITPRLPPSNNPPSPKGPHHPSSHSPSTPSHHHANGNSSTFITNSTSNAQPPVSSLPRLPSASGSLSAPSLPSPTLSISTTLPSISSPPTANGRTRATPPQQQQQQQQQQHVVTAHISPFTQSPKSTSMSPRSPLGQHSSRVSSSSSIRPTSPPPQPLMQTPSKRGLSSTMKIVDISKTRNVNADLPAAPISVPNRLPSLSPEIKHTSHIVKDHTNDGRRTVNQYIMFDHIGRGSYGTVKLAVDNETRQSYAVKILRKSRLRKIRTVMPGKIEDGLQNVRREIALMKKLHHPNVVQLYEVLDDPELDKLFMILEYVQQGPVMVIEAGKSTTPIAPEKAWKHFRDIIKGLDYLHAQKVIHRDIKPENLLIAADGTLKISDFGVSYMFEGDDDALRKTSGTPAFLAPEICKGIKSFSGRAVDIWAVGITLYCFIFGRVPFMAKTIMQIYEKIATEELVFDFEIDPVLEGLLKGLLDKNPATRITMEEIKKHPWVTKDGAHPIVEETKVVEVSEQDVTSSIRQIDKLAVVLKVKQLARRMTLGSRRNSVPDAFPAGIMEIPKTSLQQVVANVYAAAGLTLPQNPATSPPTPAKELTKSKSLGTLHPKKVTPREVPPESPPETSRV